MLLQGFNTDPSSGQFFERRRGVATLLSLAAYGALLGWAFTREPSTAEQDTQVEVEIKDLQVPEEPKPEEPKPEEKPPEPPPPPPEPEPKRHDPPPEPPPEQPPAPEQPVVPDAMPDKPPSEADQAGQQGTAKDFDNAAAHGRPGGSGRTGKPTDAVAEKPKPKPQPSAVKIDPKVPVEKPEKASNPKPLAGNAPPKYPEVLRSKGITGNVYVKILVYYDGSVRGAKILRKDNNATTPEDQELASKLFVAAVGKVMPTWKYEPAKLDGQAISVWFSVNIPFTLSQE